MKRSKKYIAASGKLDKNKFYDLESALDLIPGISTSMFEGSVDAYIKLSIAKSEVGKIIRGTVSFPHSFGKEKKLLVFANDIDTEKAKKAGADYTGLNELIEKIKTGWIDFDIVIATPDVMPKIAILGKILGTKGLMPNPKNGTVTTNVEKTIKEFKSGKIAFKSDKNGAIHSIIGKVKMDTKKIEENLLTFVKSVLDAAKKTPKFGLKSLILSPTMGPSIKIDINDLVNKF